MRCQASHGMQQAWNYSKKLETFQSNLFQLAIPVWDLAIPKIPFDQQQKYISMSLQVLFHIHTVLQLLSAR